MASGSIKRLLLTSIFDYRINFSILSFGLSVNHQEFPRWSFHPIEPWQLYLLFFVIFVHHSPSSVFYNLFWVIIVLCLLASRVSVVSSRKNRRRISDTAHRLKSHLHTPVISSSILIFLSYLIVFHSRTDISRLFHVNLLIFAKNPMDLVRASRQIRDISCGILCFL
jgi:hypothetical protein